MKLSIVVAKADNRVIGADNGLPWHLPEDLKRFKEVTMGHPMIMGRLTYESIGRPLPGRKTIVVSSQKLSLPSEVSVVQTLAQAEALGEVEAQKLDVDEVMIVGGAKIYSQYLPRVARLYVTEVHTCAEGDAVFPELSERYWVESDRQRYSSDSVEGLDYSFVTYDRNGMGEN